MKYPEIKKEKEDKVGKLIKDCRMFFAFSTEQFNEGKTEKEPDEKYLHLGAGAYMPKSCLPKWEEGMKEINKWEKDTVKLNKLKESQILYELDNREAFYTMDIKETLEVLGEGFTYEEVLKVFNENKNKYDY